MQVRAPSVVRMVSVLNPGAAEMAGSLLCTGQRKEEQLIAEEMTSYKY